MEMRKPLYFAKKMEKAMRGVRGKKATGSDDVTGDVLKVLGEDSLRIMTQHVWNWRVAHRYQ